MTSAYSINLNFNNTIPVKTDFTFKQGDKGITLNLATTGLDPTGTTAHIVFKRSNGTSVEAELTGQTGPSYSYTILGNEFEIPGVVVADLKLYNGDTQRVSTASFIFLVTGDTMDGVGGGTGGYSDQLEELSQEFSDTLEEYKDAFGDVGAVNPRGEYDAQEEYTALDLVSYNGSSYLCREGCTGIAPTNTTYWQVFASGGGGGTDDYDDLENKPSINGVELSGDKSTGDLGIEFNDLDDVNMAGATDGQVPTWDASEQKYKPGTPAAGGGGTNPNLLINPWFTVNQKGFTSGPSTHNSYLFDRWNFTFGSSAGTVTLNSSGVRLQPSNSSDRVTMRQRIEFDALKDIEGKTVTASVLKSDGTIISGSGIFPNNSTGTVFIPLGEDKIQFEAAKLSSYYSVSISSHADITIRAVKLEIGSASTLHLDTAPDYSTELLKCQWYYRRYTAKTSNSFFAFGAAINASSALAFISVSSPMRTMPTIGYTGLQIQPKLSSGISATINSAYSSFRTDYMLTLSISFSGGSVASGDFIALSLASIGDYLELNAEL